MSRKGKGKREREKGKGKGKRGGVFFCSLLAFSRAGDETRFLSSLFSLVLTVKSLLSINPLPRPSLSLSCAPRSLSLSLSPFLSLPALSLSLSLSLSFAPRSLSLSLSLSLLRYAIVTLQATGHFTGKPYSAPAHPDWPSLQPSGKRFALKPETVKVKIDKKDGKIEEIAVLPVRGGGPRGLYEALGGKMPSSK